MNKLTQDLPERLNSGHTACPGCGAALALRHVFRTLDADPVLVIAASCWSVIAGVPPFTSLDFPVIHSPLPCAAALGSGLKKGLVLRGKPDKEVVVLAGDGGTFDIGLQALSGAAHRNENIIFICYDNEAYMNTGVHSSSATPYGSHTTILPPPRFQEKRKKNIMKVIAAHNVPYAASATIAFPADLAQKVKTIQGLTGFRFLHLLAPCPTGWGYEPRYTIELSRLAVESRLFPLYEITDGRCYNVNYRPGGDPAALERFIKFQRRFATLEQDQIRNLQAMINQEWEDLCRLAT